ncbi:MAG TPA: HypC/HybG/HupF family hydrogenase formation chaperone, partial [Thermoplasmata archaeon]|nr:HypC/HybG/HupF family hydrogenase formation chaperone [Thermoplasmata archaeon]
MCLAIPGRIVSVDASDPFPPVAKVDFEGQVKSVSLLYVPEAAVGDYVIVQSGFATRRVERAEALEALTFARETSMDGVRR